MNMHMIYTTGQYFEAKAERKELVSQKPSTHSSAGKRLAQLDMVIDLYEKQHHLKIVHQ